MSVKVLVILAVVLVALFVTSVVVGARNNGQIQSNDLDDVKARFGDLMAKPLETQRASNGEITWPEVREASPCVVRPTGCVILPNQTHTLIVLKSDDSVRRVRRATFALLQAGSTAGANVDVTFTPVSDDPVAGEVRSKAEAAPTARPTQPPEIRRVHVDISRDGGSVAIGCRPTTATCVVKLVNE